jgi:O-antigen/teichoic acid export membrane protein
MTGLANKRLLSALPWMAIEGALLALSSVGTLAATVRMAGPYEYGRAVIALSVVVTIQMLTSAGLTDAVSKARSSHTIVTDTVFWAMASLGLIGWLICGGVAFEISRAYGDPSLAALIAVQGSYCLLTGIGSAPAAMLIRKMRARALFLRSLIDRVTTFVCSAILTSLGWGAWGIVLGMLAGSTAACIFLWTTQARLPRLVFSYRDLRSLLRFGSLLNTENLLSFLSTRGFFLIFGYLHGPQMLAYLNLAVRILEEIANFLQNLTSRSALAFFGAIHRSGTELRHSYLLGLRYIASLATPTLAGLAIVASEAVPLLAGDQWEPSVSVVRILCIQWIVIFWAIVDWPVLRTLDRQGTLTAWEILASTVSIAGAFLTFNSGLEIATIAFTMRYLVTVPMLSILMSKVAHISILTQIKAVTPSAAATAGMTILVLAVRQYTEFLPAMSLLILCSVLGAAAYCTLLFLFDRPTVFSLFSIGRKALT